MMMMMTWLTITIIKIYTAAYYALLQKSTNQQSTSVLNCARCTMLVTAARLFEDKSMLFNNILLSSNSRAAVVCNCVFILLTSVNRARVKKYPVQNWLKFFILNYFSFYAPHLLQ